MRKVVYLTLQVSSIKLGIWDSIYDTVQGISQNDLSKPLISDAYEYENINVEPSTKDAPVFTGHMADYAIGEFSYVCLLYKKF